MKAYDAITARVVEMIEQGAAPWHKPWNAAGLEQRSIHGRRYRGINAFMTAAVACHEGYRDVRWITYNQAKKLGGNVMRGEHGTPVVGWNWPKPEDIAEAAAAGLPRPRPKPFGFRVFNLDQTEGVEAPALPEPELIDFEPIDLCHLIAEGYLIAGGPTLEHGDRAAYYRPAADLVRMPDPERFESATAYYGTLFHELVHSTGHEARLNRQGISTHTARFGDPVYSREELVAEMGAAFLCGRAGIENETVEQSAAYLASWAKVLREDASCVVLAAGAAQRAADLILGEHAQEVDEKEVAAAV